LVQVGQKVANQTDLLYTTHYIHCSINVLDRDDTHHLNCRIIVSVRFSLGRIVVASQVFDPTQRRIAIVFEKSLNTVFVYYFWADGFGFFGRKDYASDAANRLTGVAIVKGMLFCVLEFGKRV
jgi:hypothetical protein